MMTDNDDIFEMFLEMIAQLQTEDADGHMRILSEDPCYAADNPAAEKITQKER